MGRQKTLPVLGERRKVHRRANSLCSESEDGEPSRRLLRADVRDTKPGLWFRVLSGTEQTFALIELAVALARFSAQLVPTMLLLDGGMWHFQGSLLGELATRLSAPDCPFQTVIVMPSTPKGLAHVRWAGWQVATLEPGAHGATITQGSDNDVASYSVPGVRHCCCAVREI